MDKGEVHRGEHRERPELIFDEHRPVGSPQPREVKSQKAQLESGHRHGVQNDVHLKISYKTGRVPEHKDLHKPS